MKKLLILSMVLCALPAWAHDEGHGPKLTDSPKQGGVLTSVIAEQEIGKGEKAKLIYKAELVRYAEGKVRVFLYSPQMEKLDFSKFEKKANGVLITCRKEKCQETNFPFQAEDGSFVGVPPKPDRKPFNIDIHFSDGTQKLFAAFDNLD